MHTLFDFLTYIKGIEYVIALMSIAGFILLWEMLKPAPFRALLESGREDIEYVRSRGGARHILKTMGKVAAAPFIGLAYVTALPFAFVTALGYAALKGLAAVAGRSATFGWRPTEAYLAGRKKGEEEKPAADEEKG